MKKIILIALLSTSFNTMADDYSVCVVLKKACISFVELTTEKMSTERMKKKNSCRQLKRNCNNDLDAILGYEID